MHWPTHLLIADIIHSTVKEKLQGVLNKRAFRFGSIKPDMTPRLLKIKHLKHISLNEVSKMIEDMRIKDNPEGGKLLRDYSVNLGIIMHYITDFFCYAHNHPRYVNKLEHIKYEWLVAFEYARVNKKEILKRAVGNMNKYGWLRDMSIKEYIDMRHNEYLGRKNSIKNDVAFSLEMCMIVALFIVGQGALGELFIAA